MRFIINYYGLSIKSLITLFDNHAIKQMLEYYKLKIK